MSKNRGLGRGLDSLIPTSLEQPEDHAATAESSVQSSTSSSSNRGDSVLLIEVGRIDPNPHQPRTEFDPDELTALANSIKEHGVLQPLVVTEAGERYQLIAGERRLRASKQAGQSTVPVLVRSFGEQQKLELAIIENVQRANLNPLEAAAAYRKLMEEFNLSLDQVATKVDRAKSTISNVLRLLQLPPAALQALNSGAISEAHGRAILAVAADQQPKLLDAIIQQHLSVRQAEAWVQQAAAGGESDQAVAAPNKPSMIITPVPKLVAKELSTRLGVTVKTKTTAKGGSIVLGYKDQQQLDQLLDKLKTI